MQKMVIIVLTLVSLLFLSGCQVSGEAFRVEMERTQISCCKIGDNLYEPVYSKFECQRTGGIVTPCPKVCCSSRGRILGAASQTECLRLFAGKPRNCPKFAVLK